MDFFQEPPRLGNQYRRRPPAPELAGAYLAGASAPGSRARASRDGRARRDDAPRPLVPWPPRRARALALRPVGPAGGRIRVPEAWRTFARVAAEWGLVAHRLRARARRASPRIHQSALVLSLRTVELDVYSCPLAMTDGAARRCWRTGNQRAHRARGAAAHLAAIPARAWTSGPVDDRADRRLRRRPHGDRSRAAATATGGGCTGRSGSPRRPPRDGAHAGAARGQPGRRARARALLSRDSREQTGR